MAFQPPKGTRDFLPDEAAKRRKYFELARKILESYGYGEVVTPAFETIELLEAKGSLGEEAVKDVFRIWDKGKEKLGYGLIFDPTTPIARIVASDKSLLKPLRWYYIRPMWRYEETKAGRYREFWQAGAELIGTEDPAADAEIVALTADCLKAMGIKDFTIKASSRKIAEALADAAGIPEEKKTAAFRAMDKIEKFGEAAVKEEMGKAGIPAKAAGRLLRLVAEGGKEMMDAAAVAEVEKVIDCAKKMGVEKIALDFSIIRGIDYYTGFVFETTVKGYERLGSVASGGRYDSLIEMYGGAKTPATGVGIGIDRLMEIVTEKISASPKVFVANVKEEQKEDAMKIAQTLRRAGVPAEFNVSGKGLKKQIEYANARKIKFFVVIGPEEAKEGTAKVRDMASGREEEVKVDRLKDFLAKQ
ncbi:MAG: histidine--tRNA ligase [Candidatus Aenigmatarchaeota archaeon]